MERLGSSKIWSFVDGRSDIQEISNATIRQDKGYYVSSYLELASRIAELQFRNPSYVLLFRGQAYDYQTIKGFSTIKASILRPSTGKSTVLKSEFIHRYSCLAIAEKKLSETFHNLNRLGKNRVQRQRLLRWSILQHYEVCDTPLLDVSQSLRIGASFASLNDNQEAFIYAIAVPNISGTITANVEAGLQIVRLAGACPPAAIRPHVQEGFLLSEYPDLAGVEQLEQYDAHTLDFGRRIIGKFRFSPREFWKGDTFPQVSRAALYPPSKDWLENTTAEIKAHLNNQKKARASAERTVNR